MRHTDQSGTPVIVLETSETPDTVIGRIRKSDRFKPLVCWQESRGFQAESPGALDSAVSSSHRQTREFHHALSAVAESQAGVTFLLVVPDQTASHAPPREQDKLKKTAISLHEQRNARLILTFCNQNSAKLMRDVTHHRTELASENGDSPTPQDPDEYEAALRHPATDGYWAFADDPKWKDWVDEIGPEDVEKLVERGLHRVAAARVRAAVDHVAGPQGPLLDRDRQVEIMAACAIARVNLVFLGPPGTAKSLLVREFSKALGVTNIRRPISMERHAIAEAVRSGKINSQGKTDHGEPHKDASQPQSGRKMFEYLLSRYTTPEEIFGATDIDVLIHGGVHARRTTGMLPQAEMAFLDEIFKANSAILNTLLSLTNERLFYNMGQAFSVDLAFVVGASNETPDQSELGALFDRFPIRVPCPAVPERDVRELLRRSHESTYEDHFGRLPRRGGLREKQDGQSLNRKACLNDLRLLSKVVIAGVCGGVEALPKSNVSDLFFEFFLRFRRDYGVSDRTPVQILRVCRALAMLDLQDELSASHLRGWAYIAPQYKEAAPIQRFVLDQIKKIDTAANNLF